LSAMAHGFESIWQSLKQAPQVLAPRNDYVCATKWR
jgi:hypothetical protein